MTDVLILGGTGWLSARIAQRWIDSGARVTCLARGERSAPDGARLVRGDRDDPAVYASLDAEWDEVVDISSRARHVREAVAALGERTARWTYVSSMSVYAYDVTVGADETAALHAAAGEEDEYDYGAEKVAAEAAVGALAQGARILRPGLIVGPGDPSDRFGYWAAAFGRAGTEPVLAPTTAGRWAQVIDVDDLAAFVVNDRGIGTVNAIGDPHPLADVLARVRMAAGHSGDLVEVEDAWLEQHDVAYWMGERSLPLWLPADMPGFMRRRNDAFRAAGAELSPLDDTIARVLTDERTRGLDRPRRSGLTRAEETALIDEAGR